MSSGLRSNGWFSGDPQYASGRKCASISKIDQLRKIYHFPHSPAQPPEETVQFTPTQVGPTGAYGEREAQRRNARAGRKRLLCAGFVGVASTWPLSLGPQASIVSPLISAEPTQGQSETQHAHSRDHSTSFSLLSFCKACRSGLSSLFSPPPVVG